MRTISFELTMPNRNTWNGKWSGDGDRFFIIKTLKKSQLSFMEGKNSKSFYYNFGDGWGANVKAETVDSREGRKRRKISKWFCGYDWMVDEIIKHGRIITREERIEINKKKKLIDGAPEMLAALIALRDGIQYMEQEENSEYIISKQDKDLIISAIKQATL